MRLWKRKFNVYVYVGLIEPLNKNITLVYILCNYIIREVYWQNGIGQLYMEIIRPKCLTLPAKRISPAQVRFW